MVDDTGTARFRDFTGDTEPVRFQIGDDVFTAPAEIPLFRLADMSEFVGGGLHGLPRDQMVEKIAEFFDLLLEPDSAAKFRDRLADPANPIGLGKILPILTWLLEVYGLRPTPPPPSSSTGPNDGGGGSTAGAPNGESTPEPSPPSAS